MVRIASIGTYQGNKLKLKDAMSLIKESFGNDELLDKVSTNPGISHRQLHPGEDFMDIAVRMMKDVCEKALSQWSGDRKEITHIFCACNTYLGAPTFELLLIQELGLSPSVHRCPILATGCVGAVIALHRSYDAVRLGGKCLVVCVDVATDNVFNWMKKDINSAVGSVIFSDGAAACVIDNGDIGPEMLGIASYTPPGTLEDMKMVPCGVFGQSVLLSPILSPRIHHLVSANIHHILEPLLKGIQPSMYLFHPGGKSILMELEKKYPNLKYSWEVLDEYGNMSCPTCLYVLEKAMKNGEEGYYPLVAFGQGIHMAGILIKI